MTPKIYVYNQQADLLQKGILNSLFSQIRISFVKIQIKFEVHLYYVNFCAKL